MDWKIFARTSLTKIWCAVLNCLCSVDKYFYNIASRAAESNSVYVKVLKIPIVLADGVSICMASPIFFFRASGPCQSGEKIIFRDNNGYRESAHSYKNEDNSPTFSHGLEFLHEAEKEKNNGKGNSTSAPSRFASLSEGKMQF